MKPKQQILAGIMLVASAGTQAARYNFDNQQADYPDYGDHFASSSFLGKIDSDQADKSGRGYASGVHDFTLGGKIIPNTGGLSLSLFDSGDSGPGSEPDFTINSLTGGVYADRHRIDRGKTKAGNGFNGGVYDDRHHRHHRHHHHFPRHPKVSPVPEQGVWNLLMAGLAMIGFVACRRRDMH